MLNRRYLSKIRLKPKASENSTGAIGEMVFEYWFCNTFNDELLHKQKADRDYQGIDFVDEKGYKYQVKATRAKSYTFNCKKKDIKNKLVCDFYVLVQVKDGAAYIESIVKNDYVEENIIDSYSNGNCFIYAKDLQQQEIQL